ncbi:sodium:proton antiporter [Qipengyuania citrea]|jgi:CPA1 family monovalent cation:H+ antiporter|uniref:Sodium:proton antiporter n=2 Tax=Qipengyuania TaxID=1855416 RepID=A0ABY4U768_9SPHN|nr:MULTISPECIES: sodium:proton antiporter [Qipengyuania]MAQ66658.1 sodium:proton antiporter [Sphingomonadaceae bacterium]MBG75275.1 sodium:proton antiporter [Erythrobacteraceae bacterium]MCH2496049.1 sodium:proton antiporter [Erythrobacter sp.]MEC7951493.1 sodium:proton antiporter [Pseudomonadota bacterium]QPL39280.1 sodium:proton antiporter [Erythrobacter sp. A30-3]|tara:strand:- start:274 stop:1581 length:1308 start_codon:yes stop_codon:yes gene_type:complete
MHDTSSALSAFDIAAILVVASALLGWFNHHFIKLPHVIGLTVMGALTAIGLMIANAFIPAITLGDWVADILRQLNFTETLLQGMLSFLLFAGALHVDLDRLKVAWLPVLLLSTVGVIVSTVLVGLAMWGVGLLLALPVAPIWYFVFGALIAPTDPVSVLGVLREENVPQSLQSAVAGESLFNDGVGIVVFIILLGAAISGTEFSLAEGARLFAIEAGGGILVGLAAGYVGYRALAGMDEYALEVLVTLAIVMGGYALCSYLHVSGPLAMAVAGLLVGNQGVTYAMSDVTRDYVIKFWELVDELLNSVLFLLIGLEMIVLVVGFEEAILALAAIPLTLAARAISIIVSTRTIPAARLQDKGAGPVLWWGGLRGGISIALALSLPPGETRDLILAATFAAVLFSVLVQRATLGRLIEKLKEDRAPAVEREARGSPPA